MRSAKCATAERSTTTSCETSSGTSISKRSGWRHDGRVVTDVTAETTDVLQRLIRNSCVNDGTPESGHEVRSVDLLEDYLRTPGVEMKRYEPVPGRTRRRGAYTAPSGSPKTRGTT